MHAESVLIVHSGRQSLCHTCRYVPPASVCMHSAAEYKHLQYYEQPTSSHSPDQTLLVRQTMHSGNPAKCFTVGHGSLMAGLGWSADYMCQWVLKILQEVCISL